MRLRPVRQASADHQPSWRHLPALQVGLAADWPNRESLPLLSALLHEGTVVSEPGRRKVPACLSNRAPSHSRTAQ